MGAEISLTHWLELYGPMGLGWVCALYMGYLYHAAMKAKDRLLDRYHEVVVESNTLQQRTIDVISVLRATIAKELPSAMPER